MSNYNKLDPDDYVPYAPEDVETTVYIKHRDHCDNGTDHKERLVINRFPDGVIKAFCHNCQSAGVYRPKEYVRSLADLLEPVDADDPITLPKDIDYNTNNWPITVKAELFKYDVTYQEIQDNEIGWSAGLKRLIIPIYGTDGRLMRWEGRWFGSGTAPKYIKQRVPGATTLFQPQEDPDLVDDRVIVLTEDYVSAIRIARHFPAVALGGVMLPEAELIELSERYRYMMVFLDDDNPTVLEAGTRIERDAGPIFDNVIKAYNPKEWDPKRYDRYQLKTLLDNAHIDLEVEDEYEEEFIED